MMRQVEIHMAGVYTCDDCGACGGYAAMAMYRADMRDREKHRERMSWEDERWSQERLRRERAAENARIGLAITMHPRYGT